MSIIPASHNSNNKKNIENNPQRRAVTLPMFNMMGLLTQIKLSYMFNGTDSVILNVM